MTAPKENPQPAGRHSLYRPEYCQHVEEQMGLGYSLGAFAGLIGVNRSTINEWMAAHPEFSEAVSRAKAKRLAKWELAAMKGAFTQEGGNATLLIFGLVNAGRNPAAQEDEWAQKSEVKHSGDADNPIVTRIERVIVDAKDRERRQPTARAAE